MADYGVPPNPPYVVSWFRDDVEIMGSMLHPRPMTDYADAAAIAFLAHANSSSASSIKNSGAV